MKHLSHGNAKRWLCVLLCIVAMFTMTACGGDSKPAETSAPTATPATEQPAAEATAEPVSATEAPAAVQADAANAPVEAYTIWMGSTEDSYYYDDYNKNPALQYLLSKTYGPENKRLAFTFSVPPAGSQQDNFNKLIATMDLCDLMQLSFSTQTAMELVEDGVALELTEYVTPEYMPNYCAFLDAHPEQAKTSYLVDDSGVKHYYQIYSYTDYPQAMFQGHVYRRDWLVKYGQMPDYIWADSNVPPELPRYSDALAAGNWTGWQENPAKGQAFSGGYQDASNDASWQDNVVFPSGNTEPIYISDWEWMFEQFTRALNEQGITDGYCYSLYYMGYTALGDIFSSFGSGKPGVYVKDGIVHEGYTTSTMKAYLECMRHWYEMGWLDKAYSEHTSDMFYSIDSTKVHSGKIAAWDGRQSEIGSQMDLHDGGLTEGICVQAMRLPINDLYGEAENKMVIPDTRYGYTLETTNWMISSSMKGRDIVTLLSFIDSMFTIENAVILTAGLTEEQVATLSDRSFYDRFNLPYSVYVNENGVYQVHETLLSDKVLRGASAAGRLPGLMLFYGDGIMGSMANEAITAATDTWDYYQDQCSIPNSIIAQMTSKQSSRYNKFNNNMNTYGGAEIPNFINGRKNLDTDFETFCKMVQKYGSEKVVADIQEIYDRINAAN